MNKFLLTSVCAFAVACGDVDNGELFGEVQDGGVDLGQTGMAYSGRVTPNFQMGTLTASSRGRANRTSSGQVAVIPPSKSLNFCVDQSIDINPPQHPIFTDAEKNQIASRMATLDARTGWTYTQTNPYDCAGLSGANTIQFFIGSVGSSGTSSNNIRDYSTNTWRTVSGNPGGLVDLTEGTGVVGQYQKWTGLCSCTIDRVDIYAKGTSATQDANLFDHAVGHCAAACVGLGNRTDLGSSGPFTRNTVNAAQTAASITQGEGCTLDNFVATNDGTYSHQLAVCSVD